MADLAAHPRPQREPKIRLAPPAIETRLGRDAGREAAHRSALTRVVLLTADVVATALALVVCVEVVAGLTVRPLGWLAIPLAIVIGEALGLSSRDAVMVKRSTLDEAPRLLERAGLWTLLFAAFPGAFVSGHLTGGAVLVLWGAMLALTVAARAAGRRVARAVAPVERCLVVGSDTAAERLRGKLEGANSGSTLVGRMSLAELDGADGREAAAALRDLVDDLRVDRVIIEPTDSVSQLSLDLVSEATGIGVAVSLLPRVLEVIGGAIEVDDVDGLTLLGLRPAGLSRSAALVKRCFDIAGATLALVLFAPAFAVIALRIRLDSSGPVFYRQTRIGRDGRPFTMWKFRTMIDGADAMKASLASLNEADGLFKIADDPRITRGGGWLRRYSLDEVPQLLNVLRGEMSLVGPRPLVRDDDDRITGLDRRRLQLTPGMTGRWQILGSARVPLAEMIKLDYLYVTGWSLWSDVKILLRTVPYVIARRGM